jgi:large subunit ribosomal protein L13
LRGKHKPSYTPHVDCGDNVIIINADKVKLTGNKLNDKTYYWHTGYPGGIKSRTAKKILEGKFPDRVIRLAVKRMIPKGPLGRQQFSNMKVYNGSSHPHDAQAPEKFNISEII